MGESPDRSIRTAGAEEQEAERTQEEVVDTPASTEPADPAAPSPTDTPTRTFRARAEEREEAATADAGDAAEAEAGAGEEAEAVTHDDARPEAETAAESESESEAGVAAESESAVDSATRVLRAPAQPEAQAEEEAEPEAGAPADEAESDSDDAEADDSDDAPEAAADEPDAEPVAEPKEEPGAGAGGAGRAGVSLADAETRAMSVLPPLPPAPGSSGSAGSSSASVPRPSTPAPAPASAAPAPAPAAAAAAARSVPGGATAVADSPETTVEAMEVLAGLSAKPMTPMRVALRRVRLWGTLLLLLVLVLGTVQVLRPLPAPKLTQSAPSAYAFEGGTLALDWPVKGQAAVEVPGLGLMGHSGSGNPVPLASVTKMMTAYIVLHDHPLKKGETGPTITVDQQAVNDYNTGKPGGESVQKVAAGEQLSEYQALQMLMIPSANNIARLLGRWDAGTDAAFVQKMQATAAQLGMTQSTYTDPSGLDATTRSTAADQLKLAAAAMADPVFREVVGTQQFDSPLNGLTPNTNTLVGKNGVIGIKTGSSTAALGNLVWAAEQNVGGVKQLIVGVTLSQPATGSGPGQGILDQVLANSKKLILSAEQALQGHTIAHKGDVVGYVDNGMGGRTPVVATRDVQVAGWSGLSVGIALRPLDGKAIPHSAPAGTVVGELVVGSGATAQTVPVALQSALTAPGFGAKLTRTV